MASERRSARPAKLIKKEPSFAIASSASGAAEAETPAREWIPIDLVRALPGIAITQSMQIIIEGVPDGARFSSGRNNGDKTWSLDPEDLVELGYLPPPGRGPEDQSFFVRLLTYDPDGYQIASTTAQVAVSVDGVTTRRPVRLDRGESDGTTVDAIREIEFAQRLAEAERAWEAATEDRIQQLEQNWHHEAEEQLRSAQEQWRQGEADRHRALHDQLVDMARRLREAETDWQRAESERISAALAQAADFTAQRFAVAEEHWRTEADRRAAEAEQAAQEALAAARGELQARLEAELHSRAAALAADSEAQIERRLDEAESAFERQLQTEREQFEERMQAAQGEAGAKAEAALRTEIERGEARLREIEAALRDLQNRAESSRLAHERELSERQNAWEMERAALIAASAASSDPAAGDRIAALEERWRAEAERLAQQAEARARREAEQRLAEAEASWADIAERRIADAQLEWEEAARSRDAERNATDAGRTEQQVASARARMAEVERLAAEAERRIADSERQLAQANAAREALEAEIAADRTRLEEEVQARIAEAQSAWREREEQRLADTQQGWAAAEALRLAEVQTQWMAEEDERLQTAIAAERVMLAGPDVGEMLNQAEARWREAEQERLAAAEARWKLEEDQRVATAVAAAREDMERMVEARLHRDLAVDARRVVERSGAGLSQLWTMLRWSAAGAAAATAAGVLYIAAPQIRAMIPEPTVTVAEASPPPLVEAAAPAEETPALTVAAEFVNLRAEPSTNGAVVARLQRGTRLIATERRSNWVRVGPIDGGSSGWIHSSLLEGPLPSAN